MTAMTIMNLIGAIALLAALTAVCRAAYTVAGRKHEEPTPVEVEAEIPFELERAA
jgi:hypothetical protein